MESQVWRLKGGKLIVMMLWEVKTSCLGRREKAFVASSEEDRFGTKRQCGMTMDLPLEAVAAMIPSPIMGVDVVPSARKTDRDPSPGTNV